MTTYSFKLTLENEEIGVFRRILEQLARKPWHDTTYIENLLAATSDENSKPVKRLEVVISEILERQLRITLEEEVEALTKEDASGQLERRNISYAEMSETEIEQVVEERIASEERNRKMLTLHDMLEKFGRAHATLTSWSNS